MKRLLWLVPVPGVLLVLLLFTVLAASSSKQARAAACLSSGAEVVAPLDVKLDSSGITIGGQPMSDEQAANAETIIGVAAARQLVQRDTLVILMIGLQETKLVNKDSGTGGSLGIFQQTPPAWGTAEQIMDVIYASNAIIDHLLKVPDRPDKTLLQIALDVQSPDSSAYLSPGNYFPYWQATAQAILDHASVAGRANSGQNYYTVCAVSGISDSRVQTAVQYALSVLGTPYVWGGESETGGFDCSGLVWWAFSQAGFPFSRTNAAGEYGWGVPITLDQLQPGDLVFWAYDVSDPSTIHHVAIYIGNGNIVAAPHTGDVVKVEPLFDQDHTLAARIVASGQTTTTSPSSG